MAMKPATTDADYTARLSSLGGVWRGFDSDPTHVHYSDFEALRRIAGRCGLTTLKQYSFPFPLAFGRLFEYNEFVSISAKGQPAAEAGIRHEDTKALSRTRFDDA